MNKKHQNMNGWNGCLCDICYHAEWPNTKENVCEKMKHITE